MQGAARRPPPPGQTWEGRQQGTSWCYCIGQPSSHESDDSSGRCKTGPRRSDLTGSIEGSLSWDSKSHEPERFRLCGGGRTQLQSGTKARFFPESAGWLVRWVKRSAMGRRPECWAGNRHADQEALGRSVLDPVYHANRYNITTSRTYSMHSIYIYIYICACTYSARSSYYLCICTC